MMILNTASELEREGKKTRDKHEERERERRLQHTWPHHVTMQRLATVQHCNTHFSDKLLQVLSSQYKPGIFLRNAPTIHPHALLFVCTGISIYGTDTHLSLSICYEALCYEGGGSKRSQSF